MSTQRLMTPPHPSTWLGLALVLSAALHGALAAVLWHSESPRLHHAETRAVAFELVRVGEPAVPSEPEPTVPQPTPAQIPAPAPLQLPAPLATSKPNTQPKKSAQSARRATSESKPKSKSKSKSQPQPRTAPASRPKLSGPPHAAISTPNRNRSTSPSAAPTTAAAQRRAEQAYLSALQHAIARQQHYPASARRHGHSGVATVAFTLAADGRISQIQLVQSSGHAALDRSALQALARLGRFEPIPATIGRRNWSLRIPIRFALE